MTVPLSWSPQFGELRLVQPIQTSPEHSPNIAIQEKVISLVRENECEFVSAVLEEAGTNYCADTYGIFNMIFLRQNQNKFWTPIYKSIEIEFERRDSFGLFHVPPVSITIADKDNNGRLDYLGINNSLILDGNDYHPFIASILELSRNPNYVAECSNGEAALDIVESGIVLIVSAMLISFLI